MFSLLLHTEEGIHELKEAVSEVNFKALVACVTSGMRLGDPPPFFFLIKEEEMS